MKGDSMLDDGRTINQTSENIGQTDENIEKLSETAELTKSQRKIAIILIVVVVLLFILIAVSVVFLLNSSKTEQIRDIFIIFMALESLLIGIVLVILMIQLARLINLLQNEIGPILDSINQTIGHLGGTTTFLSNNIVEPVIKANEYIAGFTQFFHAIGLVKKTNKSSKIKGE